MYVHKLYLVKMKVGDYYHIRYNSFIFFEIILLVFCFGGLFKGIFSTVAPCSYVRGHMRGMVNFSSFFGQRSRTKKNERLLSEIEKHICLKIASANKQQFNLDYLSYLSRVLIQPLRKFQQQGVEQCI